VLAELLAETTGDFLPPRVGDDREEHRQPALSGCELSLTVNRHGPPSWAWAEGVFA
jgi:hypothetical protein